jgi:DNA ligase-1
VRGFSGTAWRLTAGIEARPLRLIFRLSLVLLAVAASTLALATVSPAPTLLLAERYHGDIDVSRYWVSEKLDGVRAVWMARPCGFAAATRCQLQDGFLMLCPNSHWMANSGSARDSFDQLSAIVRRQTPDDAEWRRVRYMIFELPAAPGTF